MVETALLVGAAQILFLTCPTTRRSISRCGWCRATGAPRDMPALVNAVLRRMVARGKATAGRARHRRARHAGMADGALDQKLRRRDRARDCRRQRSRGAARSQREKRSAGLGGEARRRRSADRQRAPGRAWTGAAAARLRRRRMVGAGRGRRVCRRCCSATCAASASPICARRRAARPRSLRAPARVSPRSTVRSRGCAACART